MTTPLLKKFRSEIEDRVNVYFGFSPKETKGFIGIIILVVLLLIVCCMYKNLAFNEYSSIDDKKKLDSLVSILEENIVIRHSSEIYQKKDIGFFSFDPNTLAMEGFLSLGVDKRIARRIINYRLKGGSFKIKSDFSKIYEMDEKTYHDLYPYIKLPENRNTLHYKKDSISFKQFKPFKSYIPKAIALYDINKTDTAQLISLYGIGSKLARRIIGFREKLGGFINKEQYKEIYGLDSLVTEILTKRTLIESSFTPRRLNINSVSFAELKEHPYCRYKIAKLIVGYREQHGMYSSLEGLKNIKAISEQEWSKLLPYLSL